MNNISSSSSSNSGGDGGGGSSNIKKLINPLIESTAFIIITLKIKKIYMKQFINLLIDFNTNILHFLDCRMELYYL